MNAEVQLMINKLLFLNLGTFINNSNDLILIRKTNLYFSLNNVNSELDFKCKLLEWCSRDGIKDVSIYWQRKTRNMINYLLNTNFNEDMLNMIYCNLGNRINHQLTVDFIKSNYDFNLLTRDYCKKCPGGCLKGLK